MDLLIILGLISISSYAKCYTFQDYSSFADDLSEQFFLDEIEESNLTSDAEATNNLKQEQVPLNITTVDDSNLTFQFFENLDKEVNESKIEAENKTEDSRNPNWNYHNSPLSPKADEVSSEEILLDRLSKSHRINYGENSQGEETNFNPPPMRREVNNIQASHEFQESDMSWNYDNNYPRDKYTQTDHSDYALDLAEEKNGSFQAPRKVVREFDSGVELPQYYQKNYYYSYYPLVNGPKFISGRKWAADDEIGLEEIGKRRAAPNNRKYMRKSACRQYLEFLKYAFEKLDESPEYHYDDIDGNSDDGEQWKEKVTPKINRVFTTHILGPTLYVDNSGKVSQINTGGNSPYVFEKVSPITKISASTEEYLMEPKIKNKPKVPERRKHIEISTKAPRFGHRITHTTVNPRLGTTFRSTMDSARPFIRQETFGDHFHTNLKSEAAEAARTKHPERNNYENYIKSKLHSLQRHDGNKYRPTIVGTGEPPHFDDYDYELKSTVPTRTTLPPRWFHPEEYYYGRGNEMERTTEHFPITSTAANNKTAIFPFLWYRDSSTPLPTTKLWKLSFGRFESNTMPPYDYSVTSKNEDSDCNDKMLPCPDTFNITYPLNGYCNKYVSCESGRAIRKTCSEGLHFNIITKSCDLPHNSFCAYTCPMPNGIYGIPGDCGGYFICTNSNPEYRMCPSGMHWDIKKGLCTWTEWSSCPMKCTNKNEVKQYNGDCKSYVICLKGTPYYHKCPPSTTFDEVALTCVPDHISKCENDQRLITKNSNPVQMCREIQVKLNSKIWCNYFNLSSRKEGRQ